MAVVVRTKVDGADQAAHERLEQAIGANIERAGGPPPGLMAHVGHPDDDGLVIVEVFSNEPSFHAWWADAVAPALAELGLTSGPHDVRPVWSFARP
jgi:hypothetical protein